MAPVTRNSRRHQVARHHPDDTALAVDDTRLAAPSPPFAGRRTRRTVAAAAAAAKLSQKVSRLTLPETESAGAAADQAVFLPVHERPQLKPQIGDPANFVASRQRIRIAIPAGKPQSVASTGVDYSPMPTRRRPLARRGRSTVAGISFPSSVRSVDRKMTQMASPEVATDDEAGLGGAVDEFQKMERGTIKTGVVGDGTAPSSYGRRACRPRGMSRGGGVEKRGLTYTVPGPTAVEVENTSGLRRRKIAVRVPTTMSMQDNIDTQLKDGASLGGLSGRGKPKDTAVRRPVTRTKIGCLSTQLANSSQRSDSSRLSTTSLVDIAVDEGRKRKRKSPDSRQGCFDTFDYEIRRKELLLIHRFTSQILSPIAEAESSSSGFLLLAGPPGTGKTQSVTSYITALQNGQVWLHELLETSPHSDDSRIPGNEMKQLNELAPHSILVAKMHAFAYNDLYQAPIHKRPIAFAKNLVKELIENKADRRVVLAKLSRTPPGNLVSVFAVLQTALEGHRCLVMVDEIDHLATFSVGHSEALTSPQFHSVLDDTGGFAHRIMRCRSLLDFLLTTVGSLSQVLLIGLTNEEEMVVSACDHVMADELFFDLRFEKVPFGTYSVDQLARLVKVKTGLDPMGTSLELGLRRIAGSRGDSRLLMDLIMRARNLGDPVRSLDDQEAGEGRMVAANAANKNQAEDVSETTTTAGAWEDPTSDGTGGDQPVEGPAGTAIGGGNTLRSRRVQRPQLGKPVDTIIVSGNAAHSATPATVRRPPARRPRLESKPFKKTETDENKLFVRGIGVREVSELMGGVFQTEVARTLEQIKILPASQQMICIAVARLVIASAGGFRDDDDDFGVDDCDDEPQNIVVPVNQVYEVYRRLRVKLGADVLPVGHFRNELIALRSAGILLLNEPVVSHGLRRNPTPSSRTPTSRHRALTPLAWYARGSAVPTPCSPRFGTPATTGSIPMASSPLSMTPTTPTIAGNRGYFSGNGLNMSMVPTTGYMISTRKLRVVLSKLAHSVGGLFSLLHVGETDREKAVLAAGSDFCAA